MAERQDARAERKVLSFAGIDIAQLRQRIKAAANRRTGNAGALRKLGDRQPPLLLGESAYDRNATSQRRHEIGVAGPCSDVLCGRRWRWEPRGGLGPALVRSG